MKRLRVAPIVEGYGEVESVRILLTRIWTELLGAEYVDVVRPIRIPKSKLVSNPGEVERAVTLAGLNLGALRPGEWSAPEVVLLLLDADEDAACLLGPKLLNHARNAGIDLPIVCVLAVIEYESWFVAAAESLKEYLRIDETVPDRESTKVRAGKKWIEERFLGPRYSPRLDQPKLTARMDLKLCQERSPSFDKLCRELERQLVPD